MKALYMLLIILSIGSTCLGQMADEVKIKQQESTKTIQQTSGSSGFLSSNNFVTLKATNEGTVAEGAMTFKFTRKSEGSSERVPTGLTFNTTVSTPISGGSGPVKPLTISGLSNKSSLTTALQWIKWREIDDTGVDDAIDDYLRRNKKHFINRFYLLDAGDLKKVFDFVDALHQQSKGTIFKPDFVALLANKVITSKSFELKETDYKDIQNYWKLLGLKPFKTSLDSIALLKIRSQLDSVEIQEDFNYDDISREEQKIFRSKTNLFGPSFYFNLRFGVEHQSFKYLENQATFAETKTDKYPLKGILTVGLLSRLGIFSAVLTSAGTYQSDDPVTYLVPGSAGPAGTLVQKSFITAAPTHQTSTKLRIDYQSSGTGGRLIKVNPNINFEFSEELFSFDFPVYFLTSDEKSTKFNGGIYAGYITDKNFKFKTDKDNFGFGVFIGTSISSLFPTGNK